MLALGNCPTGAIVGVKCVTAALDGTDASRRSKRDWLQNEDSAVSSMPFVNEKTMACKVFYIAYASFCLFAVSSYTIDCLNQDAKHILSGKDPPSAIHLANR